MNNRANRVSSALDGTKTAENLRGAFKKEAEAFAKNRIYARLAEDEDNDSAKRLLLEHSDNDRRHAELWLGYLDELGDTFENLLELSYEKDSMNNSLYPAMAEIAEEEGFDEIAEKMRLVAAVKNAQCTALRDESEKIANADMPYSDNPETIWHCRSCGYDIRGNTPPERCPLCSYPKSCYAKG